jgi:hypothetical protein
MEAPLSQAVPTSPKQTPTAEFSSSSYWLSLTIVLNLECSAEEWVKCLHLITSAQLCLILLSMILLYGDCANEGANDVSQKHPTRSIRLKSRELP